MNDTDEYVERATTFQGSDASNDERLDGSESLANHYSRLSLANSLNWNGKWRDENRETEQNATAILDAIASKLELTNHQKEVAHRYLRALPSKYNQAYSTAVVALCVCGIAGRKDGRSYTPQAAAENPSGAFEFRELIGETNASHSEFASCWSSIKKEVKS